MSSSEPDERLMHGRSALQALFPGTEIAAGDGGSTVQLDLAPLPRCRALAIHGCSFPSARTVGPPPRFGPMAGD